MKRTLQHVFSRRFDSRKYSLLALLSFVALLALVVSSPEASTDTDMASSLSLPSRPKGDNHVVSFEINHKFHSTGKLTSLRVFMGIPKTLEGSQNIIDLKFSPAPVAVYDDNDTRYAVFSFHDPPDNLNFSVSGKVELHRRDLMTAISRWNASGRPDIATLSQSERSEYLKAEEFIEVNDPVIRRIAGVIESPSVRMSRTAQPKGVESSQVAEIETVQDILQWLRNNVKYESGNEPEGAAATARMGKGRCQQFSELFVTLCRAKGLPARFVGGLSTYFDKRNPNADPSHAWAEVFLSGLGWVPFDPTWMASTSDVVGPTYLYLTKIRNHKILGITNQFYSQWRFNSSTPPKISVKDSYKFKALSP